MESRSIETKAVKSVAGYYRTTDFETENFVVIGEKDITGMRR